MVDLKQAFFGVLLLICLAYPVNYTNYTTPVNITGFDQALDYAATVTNQGVGYDAFGVVMLAVFFMGFYVIGSRYTQERALVFASFMATIAAFIMVAGGFLNPMWLILLILATIAAVFFMNRVG